MSTNKNALLRYKILDSCFRNTGNRFGIKELIDEVNKVLVEKDPTSDGISRRQIYDDITFMVSSEGWEVPLTKQRDGRRVYYRYKNPSFSINNMPLNEVEINQLKSAIDILSQFKGLPQFEWIHELLPKIQIGISAEMDGKSLMDFESNQYLKGIDLIGIIYNAILFK